MKILKNFILTTVVLFLSGCTKYLDIVPKGKIIPSQTKDYRLLLDQISPRGESNGLVNSFSNDLLLSDDIEVNGFSASFYSSAEHNVLTFAEHIYQDFESDPDWSALYNQIYVCNLIIDQVMESKGGTLSEKELLSAEAKVHRAYAYYILVNLYAKQYDILSAATDLGVPIRQGIDFEEKLPRATVQQVYDYITNDLKSTLGNLPKAPQLNLNHRPVESATYALLARVSLSMNQIQPALDYADSSLKLYGTLLDYNTLPPGQSFPGTLAEPMGLQHKEVTLYKTTTTSSSLFYASKALVDLYDQQNDLRFTAKFASDAAFGLDNGFLSTGWSGKTPIKGTTTAEVYLIRAECYARQGDINNALADLNTLRKSRYKEKSNFQITASTAEEALLLVKKERRLELAFSGSRWFDIKRYNLIDQDNISIMHEVYDVSYVLPPFSQRTVLPIARKYIELNPEILQNPR